MKPDMNNMSEDFTRLNLTSDLTTLKSTEDIILNFAAIRIENDSVEDEDNQRPKSNNEHQHQNHNEQDEKDEKQDLEKEVHEDNKDVSTDSDEKTDEDVENQDEDELVERGPVPLSQTRHKKRSQPYVPPATEAIDIPGTAIAANSSRVVAKDLMRGGTMAINETVPEANSFSPDNSATTNGSNSQSRSSRLHSGGGCIQNVPAPVTVMTNAWHLSTIPTAWPGVGSANVSPVNQYVNVVDVDIDRLLKTRMRNGPSPNTTWNTTRSNPSPFSPSGSSDCSSEPLTPSPPSVDDELQFPADVAEMILEWPSDASQSPRYNPTSDVLPVEDLASMFGAIPLGENSQLVGMLDFKDRTEACSTVSEWPENDLCLQDDDGDTPLHISVANRDRKYVHAIVERMYCNSLTLDTRNKAGQTALNMAISLRYPEVVEYLLIFGADMAKVDLLDQYGGNVLHFLATNGELYLGVARELCKFDVKFAINEIDCNGHTPLHRAVYMHCSEKNSIPIVELLMYNGARIVPDPNYKVTPLHLAADRCSAELLELLCRLDPNISSVINLQGPRGNTACDIVGSLPNASQRDKEKMLQILRQYGAKSVRRIISPPLEEVLESLSSG